MENWPLVVGVEVVISGLAIVGKSGEKQLSESNEPLIPFYKTPVRELFGHLVSVLFFLIHWS